MSSAFVVNVTLTLSGRALRTVSVLASHLSLRTSLMDLFGVYDCHLYGPEEKGFRPYLALVSLSWRTGEAAGMASICRKSPLATGSLKTMVLSSGVSIAFRPSLSAEVSL